jgi:hypothetical protein
MFLRSYVVVIIIIINVMSFYLGLNNILQYVQ